MKNCWIILLILTLSPVATYSSVIKHYGVKGGITFANQKFTGVWWKNEDSKRRTGFNAGVFVEFFDCSNFSMLTQLEFTQRGMIEENSVTDENGNELASYRTESTLNYLSFPVSAKYSIPIPQIIPYFIAGLRYDYLLDHESIVEIPGELQIGSEKGPFTLKNTIYEDFTKNVFGAQFGFGVSLDLFSGFKPALEFRYNIDLTNSLSEEGQSAKNNSFDISLFLPIDL